MDPDRNEDRRNRRNDGRNYNNSVVDVRARHLPGDNNAAADNSAPESGLTQDSADCQQFSMIPPNESRHSKLKRMAQIEEENLQRYREANRPTSVHTNPEMLGGAVSLAEARERQFEELHRSRIQKKLKKEEDDRKRRQEMEAELQKMREKQREKAERLEEKRLQEERTRREQQRETHIRMTDQFLRRLERVDSAPVASQSAPHTSPWARAQGYREARRGEENLALKLHKEEQRRKGEVQEERQRAEEEEERREVQTEHRQVNAAFLDRLQARAVQGEVERPPVALEGKCVHGQTGASAQKDGLSPQEPGPAQGPSVWGEEADPDYEWMVMKLQSRFPDSDRAFLEDIVVQCNGDFHQACQLLQ